MGRAFGHRSKEFDCAAAVAALACALLVATGVSPAELARFLAFQALVVVLPGVTLVAILAGPRLTALEVIAIGWAAGLAAEVLVYTALSALDARGGLLVYAAGVLVLGGLPALRRVRAPREGGSPQFSPGDLRLLTLIAGVALVYLGVGHFLASPLPESGANVAYDVDNVFSLSVAAEAAHHWPVTTPWVAGEPLRYYLLAFVDMAAVRNLAGVELATQVLRLFPLTIAVVAGLNVLALTRRVSGKASAAVVSVALLTTAGTLDLNPGTLSLGIPALFPRSHTFLLAAPFFLAALNAIALLAGETRRSARLGLLALIALLAAGAAGTKSMAVVALMGGLGLSIVAGWLGAPRLGTGDRLAALALTIAVSAGAYSVFIGDEAAGFLSVDPGGPEWREYALLAGVALLPSVALLRRHDVLALVGSLLAGGLVAAVMRAPGESQAWFLHYGVIAGVPLAAWGLVHAWRRFPTTTARREVSLALGGGLAVCFVAAGGLYTVRDGQGMVWSLATFGPVGLVVVLLAWRLKSRYCALTLIALALTGLCFGNLPVKVFTRVGADLRHGRALHPVDSPTSQGLVAGLYDGLRWVRAHSRPTDILAVNTHHLDRARRDARYFYFSAFTERRVFLESWAYLYSKKAAELLERGGHGLNANPFPERLRINEAAFRGEARALGILRGHGVRYLLYDTAHGASGPAVVPGLRRVFSSPGLSVFEIPRR